MKTYIVLLRGINIGGNKKVPMAILRETLELAGFEGVKTYVKSGNIVLQSSKSREIIEEIVEKSIEDKFGFTVSVFVKTLDEWESILRDNPFACYEDDEGYLKMLSVTFLKNPLSAETKEKIIKERTENEDFFFTENCLYLWCGDGFGRSKIAQIASKYPAGTTRNWNSILKIKDA